MIKRDAVDRAVGAVLFNAMNHPDPVAVIGRDTGRLRKKIVEAVLPLFQPRVITTVDDLAALPIGSIIEDSLGMIEVLTGSGWEFDNCCHRYEGHAEVSLPARLLYAAAEGDTSDVMQMTDL